MFTVCGTWPEMLLLKLLSPGTAAENDGGIMACLIGVGGVGNDNRQMETGGNFSPPQGWNSRFAGSGQNHFTPTTNRIDCAAYAKLIRN